MVFFQDGKQNMNANGDDHISFTAMDISLDDSGNYLTVATGRVTKIFLQDNRWL